MKILGPKIIMKFQVGDIVRLILVPDFTARVLKYVNGQCLGVILTSSFAGLIGCSIDIQEEKWELKP